MFIDLIDNSKINNSTNNYFNIKNDIRYNNIN